MVKSDDGTTDFFTHLDIPPSSTEPVSKENKTLYWVKFIEQGDGLTIDAYFQAKSISEIDENVADILEIKVIKEVIQL